MSAKSKRICISSVLLLVAVGMITWSARRPKEPVYEGKPLRAWLEGHTASSSANPPYNSPGWLKADQALRHIGTNAIPTLLAMVRAKDSAFKLKLVSLARKQRWFTVQHRYAQPQQEEAEYAFRVLGTNAAGAVPALIDIYQANVSPSSQRCAALSLASIGRPARAALPVLLQDFTHTNDQVRFYALSAVIHIGGEPELVIPALRRSLKDSYKSTRWNAATGLGGYGKSARAAVPDLLEALKDASIQEAVENTLWYIAPEKVGKPLVIGESTTMVTNGVTTEAIEARYRNERRIVIRPGTAVPCLSQFWDSEPRPAVSYYRVNGRTNAEPQFLGTYEVLGMAPPPARVNVGLLVVVTDQQILLVTRDYGRNQFLEVRRVEAQTGP